jgi:hypothetical protein
MTAKPKKKKKFNANSATLKYLAEQGIVAELVESRIPTTWITRDLFGIVDILALVPGSVGVTGYQATSGGGSKGQSNGLARHRKLLASEKAKLFVECHNALFLVVWNEVDGVFKPTFTQLCLGDFETKTLAREALCGSIR